MLNGKKEEESLHDFEPVSQEPPEWLNDTAKAEYLRVIPLMTGLPIAALDEASVAMYCDYYSMYVEASQSVEREGRTITEIDSQGNDKRRINPEFTVMTEAARMVRVVAGNIGLTIDSRMRIVVPQTEW